jgi:hypothetical protein
MGRDPIDLDGCRSPDALKAARRRRREREGAPAPDAGDGLDRGCDRDRMPGAAPAVGRTAAALRARYLIRLFADTPEGRDPLRQRLIELALDDLDRMVRDFGKDPT